MTKFTVAFDATTAAFAHKTGTGVYTEEVITKYQNAFPEDKVVHSYRLVRRLKGSRYLLPLSSNAHRSTVLDPWTCFKGSAYDIFHGLNSRLPLLCGCKKVATIHDLFSIFGQFADPSFRDDQSRKLRQMIGRADHIIVPASYTKGLLVSKMEVPEKKVTVVPEGTRDIFCTELGKERAVERVQDLFGVQRPFLLFVGTLEKRKNVLGLLDVYCALAGKLGAAALPDLVLVGGPGYKYLEIQNAIEKSGLKERIRQLGFVGESELVHLYTAAQAFVFLTFEEGFGIPVLEAMACKTAIVSSDTTSLPEVGNGFTWLVKPTAVTETVKSILEILQNKESVRARVEAGAAYARGQTWTKVAKNTRSVYEKLMSR